jgi:hypothetical protein
MTDEIERRGVTAQSVVQQLMKKSGDRMDIWLSKTEAALSELKEKGLKQAWNAAVDVLATRTDTEAVKAPEKRSYYEATLTNMVKEHGEEPVAQLLIQKFEQIGLVKAARENAHTHEERMAAMRSANAANANPSDVEKAYLSAIANEPNFHRRS